MAYGVNLTDDPVARISLAGIAQDALKTKATRLEVGEAERVRAVQQGLRRAIQRNTKLDATGKAVIDHQAVTNEIRQLDPLAAEDYAQKAAKTQLETQERQMKLVGNALAAVDENNEDQRVAEAQYADAVRYLKQNGVRLDPSDEVYSRGRVSFWRRQLAGAEKVFAEAADTARNDADNETELVKHKTPSGDTIVKESEANFRHVTASGNVITQQSEANFRHVTPSGDTVTRESEANWRHTTQGAGKAGNQKATEDGPVSFLPQGASYTIGDGPGPRKAPMTPQGRGSSNHKGTDYRAARGTPIIAEQGGTVISAGMAGGYGNQVKVRYDDGSVRSYSHADRLYARAGQRVTKGQPMATVGSTGKSTGPHVHVEDHAPAQGQRSAALGEVAPAPEDFDSEDTENALRDEGQTGVWRPSGNGSSSSGVWRPSGATSSGAVARPPASAPAASRPEKAPSPAAPGRNGNDVVGIVAKGVLNYAGRSRMSKQGAIDTRTHPMVKRMREVDFEGRIADMQRVASALASGELRTGAGADVNQLGRRAKQFVENITGWNVSDEANDSRVAAYEVLKRTETLAAIEALRGVGGNDTDRDFDRAIQTTVNALRSGKANKEIATNAIGLLKLGRDRLAFYERWANVAGSVQNTIDGVSVEEAWARVSGPRIRDIMGQGRQAAGGAKASAPTNFRIVKDGAGNRYRQYANGKLERIKQ